MPEIPPLTDADWPEACAGLMGGFATQLNVYRTMAHHPALLNAWAPLREHIVLHSALGKAYAEVVILRAGYRLGSAYEWSHHVQRGRAVGLSDARIAALKGPLEGIEEPDRTLAQAVDELMQGHALTAATQDALTVLFGNAGMFDLIATTGFYTTLGYILNSFATPLDADVPPAAL